MSPRHQKFLESVVYEHVELLNSKRHRSSCCRDSSTGKRTHPIKYLHVMCYDVQDYCHRRQGRHNSRCRSLFAAQTLCVSCSIITTVYKRPEMHAFETSDDDTHLCRTHYCTVSCPCALNLKRQLQSRAECITNSISIAASCYVWQRRLAGNCAT
jgi:hypothetical protein